MTVQMNVPDQDSDELNPRECGSNNGESTTPRPL